MVNFSKNKGSKEERAIVNKHREQGFVIERTLESGKRSDGSNTWDLNLETPTGILKGECKIQANGFKQIYEWLKNDFLTIRADNKKRLYVVTEDLWFKLLKSKGK